MDFLKIVDQFHFLSPQELSFSQFHVHNCNFYSLIALIIDVLPEPGPPVINILYSSYS